MGTLRFYDVLCTADAVNPAPGLAYIVFPEPPVLRALGVGMGSGLS
jgi:hypothetical protein